MKKGTFNLILALTGFLCAPILKADEKIAHVINHVSPHVGLETAEEYAIIIDRYATEYDVSWKVIVAIVRQESNFIHGEINDNYKDFGISQFNWRTIKHKQLDLGLLLTDIDYVFHETVKHLAFLKKRFNTGSKGHWAWYTRWNSYTPSTRRTYWYGTREHKHKNGLKNKFMLIERALKDYERKKSYESNALRDPATCCGG